MKLILAIVQDSDSGAILETLINSGFNVTRISATGGFLKRGQATFLIGTADEKVQECVQIIREHTVTTINPGIKHVTIFVLKVEHFEQV
jgi:uncharacterized protein YaaQ